MRRSSTPSALKSPVASEEAPAHRSWPPPASSLDSGSACARSTKLAGATSSGSGGVGVLAEGVGERAGEGVTTGVSVATGGSPPPPQEAAREPATRRSRRPKGLRRDITPQL